MKFLSNILAKAGLIVDGTVTLNSVANASVDTDRFIVIDNGVVKYRTGAQLRSDIDAAIAAAGLPVGGTAGQILAKIDGTNYNTEWIDNYTTDVRQTVKAGENISKGQAVYISSADGTNVVVSKASNTSDATSSKTLGLLAQNLSNNGQGFVITEGKLTGIDTSTAQAGDPVWLGTNGNLLFGLANKPIAPAHLVYLGVVTRANQNNGEIFVHVVNGFELEELHDVLVGSYGTKDVLWRDTATNLWKNRDIFNLIGAASGSANGYLTSTDWNTFNNKQNSIALTTSGSSGAATLVGSTLNIPQYTLSGLGGVPSSRQLTINGTSFDLSSDRSWSIVESDTLDSVTDRGATTTNILTVGGIYNNGGATTVFGSETNYFFSNRISSSGTQGYKIKGYGTDLSFWRYDDGTGFVEFGNAQNYGLKLYANNNAHVYIHPSGNTSFGNSLDSNYRVDVTGEIRASSRVLSGLGGLVNNCLYTYISNHCGSAGYIGFGFVNTTNPAPSDSVFDIYQGPGFAPIANLFNIKHSLLNTSSAVSQSILGITTTINQTGSGDIRGIYYNPSVSNIVGDHYAWESTSGKFKISDLAGTGTRMVVANSSGVLSTQAITVGTVTSVGLTAPTGFTVSNSPITTSGDIALSFASGYSLPTTASQNNWDTAYSNRITSLTTSGTSGAATLSNNTLNIPQYQAQGNYITSLTGEATASGPGAASVTLSNSAVTGKILSGLNVTGGTVVDTDSILTAFGKLQNQVNGLAGGVTYQGAWNASTNSPALTSSVGTKGYYYVVSVAGSTDLNGITDWKLGDWAIFNGTSWEKVDNTDAVVSVNGFTGAVSLTTSNINEGTNLYYTDARARAAISLTTNGNSGAATYSSGVLNIPQYTLSGLGGVATSRTLTINGTSFDLSADRTFNVGTVTSVGLQVGTSGNDVNVSNSPITSSGNITLNIPDASSTARGLITTGTQTIAGQKTFNSLTTVFDSNQTATFIEGRASGVLYGGISFGLFMQYNAYPAATSGFLWKNGNGDNVMAISQAGAVTLLNLAGSGNRMVIANSSGVLSTQAIPTGTVTSVGLSTTTSGVTIGSTPVTSSGTITVNIATASGSQNGLLSSTDWTTFNNKIGGSGTNGNFPIFTGTGTIGNSEMYYTEGANFNNINFGFTGSGAKYATTELNIYSNNESRILLQFAFNKYAQLSNEFGNVYLGANNSGIHGFNNIFYYNGSSAADRYLSFQTEGLDRLTIEQNGDVQLNKYTTNGFLRTSGSTGTLTVDTTAYQPLLTNPVTGTGVSGQVAYFNGTNSVTGESNLFWDAANDRLGIGTNTPASTLTVLGDAIRYAAVSLASGNAVLVIKDDGSNGTLDICSEIIGDANAASNPITFRVSNVSAGRFEAMRINSSGNLGLGVTPSAWDTNNTIRAMQLNAGSLWNFSTTNLILGQNSFSNTSGVRTYVNNGFASEYEQGSGQHIWKTAPSGTAGNAITFTQAMTLSSAGYLGIGSTNPYGQLTIQNITNNLGGLNFTEASDGSSRRWQLRNDVSVFGDFSIRQSTTQTGTTFTDRLYISSGGNVGIGTASPAVALDVAGVGRFASTNFTNVIVDGTNSNGWGNNIAFRSQGSDFGYIGSIGSLLGNTTKDLTLWATSGNALRFYTNGSTTERMRLDTSGNLGLGVTPSAWGAGFTALQVRNASFWSTGSDASITANAFYDGSVYRYIATTAASRFYHNTDGSFIWSQAPSGTAGNAISFTQAMTLDASGNLSLRLATGATTNLIGFQNSSGTQIQRLFYDDSDGSLTVGGGTSTGYPVKIFTGNTERMRITSGGNVLINTQSGTGRLVIAQDNAVQPAILLPTDESTIQGPATNTQIRMGGNLVLGASSTMTFGTGGSERMRITSTGAVGIGTTNPNTQLHVAGSLTVNDIVYLQRSSSSLMLPVMNYWNGSGSPLAGTKGDILAIGNAGGDGLVFVNSNTERMRITSGGNVGIGTNSPKLNGNGGTFVTIDGGSSFSAWLELATSSTTDGVGGALSFNNNNIVGSDKRNAQIAGIRDGANNSGALAFATWNAGTGAERMRITSGGNVGIGETNPTELLVLKKSTYPTIDIKEATDNSRMLFQYHSVDKDFRIKAVSNHPLTFGTNDIERMRITSGGNVGIGTTNPGATLHVNGTIRTADLYGGTAHSWKLGKAYVGAPPTPTITVEVEINGSIYQIGATTV